MSTAYNYTLGIDLGIASIGTAIIQVDTEGQAVKILDAGTRIFDTPEGAAERRQKRQERKILRRRRQRLQQLTRLLQAHGLFPDDAEEAKNLLRRPPYRMRAHGMRHPFTHPHELGRCLLHLAKFRGAGFLEQLEDSAQEGDTAQAPKDKAKSANLYRHLEDVLKQTGQTLSEYFFRRIREYKVIRRRKHFVDQHLIEYAVPRFVVKDDFKALWDNQARFFPQLTDSLKTSVYDCIFADHPHAPYGNGFCSLDPDSREYRLPRMHRLSEMRRLYEQVNNLRLQSRSAVMPLTLSMRDCLIDQLMQGTDLTRKSIAASLQALCDEKIEKINMGDDTTKIKAFSHVKAFAQIPAWQKMTQAEQDAVLEFIAEPRLEPDNIHSCLMPEEDYLRECCTRLGLGAQDSALVSRCINALPKDRSMLGRSATEHIIQKLREGLTDAEGRWYLPTHRQAADACGYVAEEEKHRKLAGTYTQLPYYGSVLRHDTTPVHPWHIDRAAKEEATFGRIPNPVVHVVLNQVRHVVNEILNLYGKPQRIHIELAREFGLSALKREALSKEQEKKRKENESIDKELAALHLPPTRKNRTKYRLWLEQGMVDAYTLQAIQATEFAGYEIDHIIPQSQGGTDTFSNLALTEASVNLAKGDSFAYPFVNAAYPDIWPKILQRISEKKFPRNKAWRFMPDAQERFGALGDEDQTDHRLHDTSYMAKMAARYLSLLCPVVVPVRGAITARLRHEWGLDGLEYALSNIPVRKEIYDPHTGEVLIDPQTGYPQRNPAWQAKPRIDHRHHALDAIVLACTTRSTVQRMTREERLGNRNIELPAPMGGDPALFRQQVLEALRQVRVSSKAEHALNGQLHDATMYRVLAAHPKDAGSYIITYRRQLNALKTKQDVANIAFSTHTFPDTIPEISTLAASAQEQCRAIQAQYSAAEDSLREQQRQYQQEGRKVPPLNEMNLVQEAVRLARKTCPLVKTTYPRVAVKSLVGIRKREQGGYEPQNNYCVDFFENAAGKVEWECITRFAANQPRHIPQWQQDGHTQLWRLCKGDVLEMCIDEDMRKKLNLPVPAGKVLFVVQKFSKNQLAFNILYDARPLDKKQLHSRWLSGERGLITFTQSQARKVTLTPFGKLRHKHKKLWHGAKTQAQ